MALHYVRTNKKASLVQREMARESLDGGIVVAALQCFR